MASFTLPSSCTLADKQFRFAASILALVSRLHSSPAAAFRLPLPSSSRGYMRAMAQESGGETLIHCSHVLHLDADAYICVYFCELVYLQASA